VDQTQPGCLAHQHPGIAPTNRNPMRHLHDQLERYTAGDTWSARPPASGAHAVALTSRQSQVLKLLSAGHGEKGVARELGLSRHTVHVHVKGMYRRLGVQTRSELFCKLLRQSTDAYSPAATEYQVEMLLLALTGVLEGMVHEKCGKVNSADRRALRRRVAEALTLFLFERPLSSAVRARSATPGAPWHA
jgi:DNA-binding CsgD family transcriptional regulator